MICSYQNGSLDKFGMDEEGIRKINPSVIFGSLVCFSDTVWRTRPGWAPCAEDITGLSVRNGSIEQPVNLNGVPLDYIPGMILYSGIIKALMQQAKEGGGYSVYGSLTRGGYWLHECTDLWEQKKETTLTSALEFDREIPLWKEVYHVVEDTAVGDVYFPAPATYSKDMGEKFKNMHFTDGNTGFRG